jgi:hypothetical protein
MRVRQHAARIGVIGMSTLCNFVPDEIERQHHCERCGFIARNVIYLPIYRNCPLPTQWVAGVGTELKRLLAAMGIVPTPNCKCNQRAAYMDAVGPEWCAANVPTIVGWLKEEADARSLPFFSLLAGAMVKRAIRNARHAATASR